MNIAIFNPKGGVGKTNISFTLAYDFDYDYITNDGSIVPQVYKKSKVITSQLPIKKNTVYDLGGFNTDFIGTVLNNVDKIIIPTINDFNSLLKAFEVIDFTGTKKVIVVANMVDSEKDIEEIKEAFNNKYKDILVMPLKRSKVFRNGLLRGMSIKEVVNESGLNKHIYRNVNTQYEELIKEIQK